MTLCLDKGGVNCVATYSMPKETARTALGCEDHLADGFWMPLKGKGKQAANRVRHDGPNELWVRMDRPVVPTKFRHRCGAAATPATTGGWHRSDWSLSPRRQHADEPAGKSPRHPPPLRRVALRPTEPREATEALVRVLDAFEAARACWMWETL